MSKGGRPKKINDFSVIITIKLSPEETAMLDRLAEVCGKSRTDTIHGVIEQAFKGLKEGDNGIRR